MVIKMLAGALAPLAQLVHGGVAQIIGALALTAVALFVASL